MGVSHVNYAMVWESLKEKHEQKEGGLRAAPGRYLTYLHMDGLTC